MKKILILLAAVCCCGCNVPPKTALETSKVELTTVGYMKYVKYDGHEYLIWSSGGYQGGICHSPNCPCKTK